jgi:hypothetical protein
VNAEQFNALYPVGTPVFAYPGFRPEDASDARRLVTRTRTAAQVSASGDPVVWVEGEGSYICLTHVDPVPEDVWQEAWAAEKPAEPKVASTLARLTPQREAEYQRWVDGPLAELMANGYTAVAPLLAELAAVRAERDEAQRYAARLEAEICQCQPELESGEYMHEATCPVAEIQMRMVGCPGFEGNPVAPGLCAGCHEPREGHQAAAS